MSTITKEFTKEQLQQIIETDHVQCGEASALARIALASLEAEAYGYVHKAAYEQAGSCGLSSDHEAYRDSPTHIAVYTVPPAPVSVPDEDLLHMAASAIDDLLSNKDRSGAGVWADIPAKLRRAAMLQGADGNSPVIPDGWVACSERMPDDDDFVYIWPRPDFGVELHVGQYCECHPKGDGWYAQVYEQNYGIEWCPITVTHWMPLPAAPQQEVTQALAKGMERYGDAMQKLADSGD
ncbi:DUF551 domain-containing protein [Enterobacter roggenkampii]|uniref:DUF551 domain-containing protein n=1 Tax=Enterobacter roggenkampii TaxID=1812935 RepID=UPI002002C656|nr:DUF551 domain-containing protein [Enterobacter roggenkampii]